MIELLEAIGEFIVDMIWELPLWLTILLASLCAIGIIVCAYLQYWG